MSEMCVKGKDRFARFDPLSLELRAGPLDAENVVRPITLVMAISIEDVLHHLAQVRVVARRFSAELSKCIDNAALKGPLLYPGQNITVRHRYRF
jgi:hypothetical protein